MRTKKVKSTKRCAIKQKLKYEDYKKFLEATQLETKINRLEKKKNVDSLRKSQDDFIKNNSLIIKSQ